MCFISRNKHLLYNNNIKFGLGFEWTWDREFKSPAAEVSANGREARFHVNYSSGTAAVRGSEPMTDGQYFWEIKMISPVYGTDMVS